MALGFDVRIEQDLFAGNVGVLVQRRRVPVVGITYRATALDAILLAFERAGVVPPLALPRRYRQVGFLGTRLDLVEDLLPQRFEVGGHLVDVAVFRLEVGDHVGVRLLAQPLIGVDEDVTVVLAPAVHPLGDGRHGTGKVRLAHAAGPIQSPKLRPEMRS